MSTDNHITQDNWSDLRQFRELPNVDFERLHAYRLGRIRAELKKSGAAMCIIHSPVSLRYTIDYDCYQLFQSHQPQAYVFVSLEGPTTLFGAYIDSPCIDKLGKGRPITVFDGGDELNKFASLFAQDVEDYLIEIGSDNRTVAIEYINPSITQALEKKGLEVIDGVNITEQARVIKSADEIECIKWSIAVAELGIVQIKKVLKPGVTETQLWGLLNYTNLANHGGWHDGRMLASGDRINPWYQEATQRVIQDGDLVGLDTDMVGPYGYFADVSRTFHCGPSKPTKRQKQLYRLAVDEIEYNMKLMRPGLGFKEFQQLAYPVPEEFQQNAYTCICHAVGMCDEYPQVDPVFRGENNYDGTFEAGMVICIESYMGAVGERDGVKLEQQILITDNGYELLTNYPYEEELLN